MPQPLAFRIDGPVVGKGRGRAAVVAGHAHIFTPAKTRSYEGRVAYAAQQAMGGRPLIDTPVHLDLTIICPIPDGWPGWKKAAARSFQLWPTTKPDLDNVVKLLADALNEVVWVDDTRIVSMKVLKHYGDRPGLQVTVRPMVGLAAQVTRRPAEPDMLGAA